MGTTLRILIICVLAVALVRTGARAATHDAEKAAKFVEIETFSHDPETVEMMKASWLTSRGNSRGNRGELELAMKDFREAISKKSDHTPAHIGLAICLQQKKMHKDAMRTLAAAPDFTKLHGEVVGDGRFELNFYRALNYARMQDVANAVEFAKRALAVRHDPKRLKLQRQAAAALNDDSLATQEQEMTELLQQIVSQSSP